MIYEQTPEYKPSEYRQPRMFGMSRSDWWRKTAFKDMCCKIKGQTLGNNWNFFTMKLSWLITQH